MPNLNATAQQQNSDSRPITWVKLKDLEIGKRYPIIASWQKEGEYDGKRKMSVKLKLSTGIDSALGVDGNADLFAKLYDSHVKAENEGYSITITEHGEYNGYVTCKVLMECDPDKAAEIIEADLPF